MEGGCLVPLPERVTRSHGPWERVLPPFLGSSSSPAGTSLGGVRSVSAWVWGEKSCSQEGRCLFLDKDPSPVPPSWRQEKTSHCSLALTPAQQASLHQPQARGCPVLTAAGQGSQPSVCPLPPAQPCPGFPAPHLLPAPCHCCLPPELSPLGTWDTVGHRGPGLLVTTFPGSPCATGWSASLQVPACPHQSQGRCGGGGSPPPLTP